MLFVLHRHKVLILSFKLDNAVVGRYLSLQDNEFVDCVVADIKQFVNRSHTNKSVLVFPPVNNYRRFLIHKVSEDYSEELCTFSIGQGHGRRTVVCFKRHLIRDVRQTSATDESVTGTSHPVGKLGAMGVDRQHLADQAAATPCRDSSIKRAKAVPTVGIYRPPAARRSEEHVASVSKSRSPTAEMREVKPERARPTRQRRPDIQVYVPRAKRLSTGEQDRSSTSSSCISSSSQLGSPSLKSKGSLHSRTLTAPPQKSNGLILDQGRKSKSVSDNSHGAHTTVSGLHYWNNVPAIRPTTDHTDLEVSDIWSKSTKQISGSNNQLSDFSLEMSDVELDTGREEITHLISTGNVQSICDKKVQTESRKNTNEGSNSQLETEEIKRGLAYRGSKSSSCGSTPEQSGRDTPNSNHIEGKSLDFSNDVGNGANSLKSALLHYESDIYNSPTFSNSCQVPTLQSFSANQECDTIEFHCRQREKFDDRFLEEVNVNRGVTHRSSKSSSSDSTSEHSGRNTPSSITDNVVHGWDYFSEIKNATNSSQNKVLNCEMDIQSSSECSSVTKDSRFVSNKMEDSDTAVKSSDNSEQWLDCSNIINENKLVSCDYDEVSSIPNDTSFSSSVESGKPVDSGDKMCSKDIFVGDECRDCKKDENDECRVQEEQNRKNRRIIRNNVLSDVLIISDPKPVTDISSPPVQTKSSSEKTSSPNGVLNKKKKVRHKGENATSNCCSSVRAQSADKQKSSPTSSPVPVSLNPEECTWDMMFDDNGDCLDPKLMDELTTSVGSVTIQKPHSDYRNYQSRIELMMSGGTEDEFSHVLEIYNFPAEFKTQDLYTVFSPYMKGGFEIKWVDDTHALGVFSSSLIAAEVLAADHPFVKTRPLHQATHESRIKVRRSAEFLQPYRARPETCAALARRLVTGALGVRLNTTPEEREAERKILKEAREKRRLAARQRDEAWEGTLGEK